MTPTLRRKLLALAERREELERLLSDPDVVAALHAEFTDLGRHERHVLEVGGLDRNAVPAAVITTVTNGTHRLMEASPHDTPNPTRSLDPLPGPGRT